MTPCQGGLVKLSTVPPPVGGVLFSHLIYCTGPTLTPPTPYHIALFYFHLKLPGLSTGLFTVGATHTSCSCEAWGLINLVPDAAPGAKLGD